MLPPGLSRVSWDISDPRWSAALHNSRSQMAMLDLVDTLQALWLRLWLCLIVWDFGRLVLRTDSDACRSGVVSLGRSSCTGMGKTWMLDTVDALGYEHLHWTMAEVVSSEWSILIWEYLVKDRTVHWTMLSVLVSLVISGPTYQGGLYASPSYNQCLALPTFKVDKLKDIISNKNIVWNHKTIRFSTMQLYLPWKFYICNISV